MTVDAQPKRAAVDLIPWDADSREHIHRLIEQRVACRWDADKVDGVWREAQKKGTKCIYWLVLPMDDPQRDEKMKLHIDHFAPQQTKPLTDTCSSLRNMQLTPTEKTFIPIGHIALDTEQPSMDKFNLDIPRDGSAIWIKSLWISNPLQAHGLGRGAMDTLEAMATSPPLSARTLVLDTAQKDDQKRLRPSSKVVNQLWYERRGFRVIETIGGLYTVTDEEFRELGIEPFFYRAVVMRKDLE